MLKSRQQAYLVLTLVNISFHCEAHGYKILYQLKIDLSFIIALLANGELRLLIAYLYTKTIQRWSRKREAVIWWEGQHFACLENVKVTIHMCQYVPLTISYKNFFGSPVGMHVKLLHIHLDHNSHTSIIRWVTFRFSQLKLNQIMAMNEHVFIHSLVLNSLMLLLAIISIPSYF